MFLKKYTVRTSLATVLALSFSTVFSVFVLSGECGGPFGRFSPFGVLLVLNYPMLFY